MSGLTRNLDETLEAAIVVAWDDLIQAGKPGLVHVRYRFASDHSLADLQVWASEIRGHWMLVCQYPGTSATGSRSLTFCNVYRSDLLAQFLDFVTGHQSVFVRAPQLDRDSLVQVQVPTEVERARALKLMNEAQAPLVLANAG